MRNVLDYVYWRGDLPIEADALNEADIVVLSRLSYLPFDGKVSEKFDEQIILRDAAKAVLSDGKALKNMLWNGDKELLELCAESARFGDLKISGFVNKIENEKQMQFSAMVLELDENTLFLSFRGTDSTFVGWQEDCNMYTMFPLPSQEESVAYLERAARSFKGRLILGGHSKGGNLAMFSASFCSEETQSRVSAVYNLDGFGFDPEAIKNSRFTQIKDRVVSYIPQTSVFGMMLEHEEKCLVIKSNQKGILQHDIYSWELDRTSLVKLDGLTEEGVFFDRTLRDFVSTLSLAEKRQLINAVFDVLKESEGKTFPELWENIFKESGAILKALKNLPPESRSLVMNSLGGLIKSAGSNIPGMLQSKRKGASPKAEGGIKPAE